MHSYRTEREALGARLRQLRTDAGLTGQQMADHLGWAQPKVSKIETGKQAITESEMVAWARAVSAPPKVEEELQAQFRRARAEYASWRKQFRAGPAAHQEEIRELEARADAIIEFQPAIVPGLIQTADYARETLSLESGPAKFGMTDIEPLVAARMRRQQVIYDQSKKIQLIVTEATLRHRLASREVHLGQLDRILAVAGLPSIEFGVVPFQAELPLIPLNAFMMYDRSIVIVESLTGEQVLRDFEEIRLYEQFFDAFSRVARRGTDAAILVRRAISDLENY